MAKAIDLIGYENRYFKVLQLLGTRKKRRWWKCQCKCGKIVELPTYEIRTEHTKSCGCSQRKNYFKKGNDIWKKAPLKHGLARGKLKHPLYFLWLRIKRRCYRATKHDFPYYQGKGITICNEWLNNVHNFFNWAIKNGWQKGLSIDRIDPTGNYEPKNCRFITMNENRKRIDRTNFFKAAKERFKKNNNAASRGEVAT